MDPTVIFVLLLLGGLGCFMVGMTMLQNSTEKLASGSLKKLFSKTANNPLIGAGLSTVATIVMQSSGATTVMVVGFVNSGAMSLAQAASYIMGANIGTTITAQIAALGDFPIAQIFIACTLVGVFLTMFFGKKHDIVGTSGSLIAGLGLLFLGLNVMSANFNNIFNANPDIVKWLGELTNPFLLLLIGCLATALVQSSSVITSIVISMALANVLVGGSGNGVLFIVLGTNIGSCATALLSAIGSTTNGKRAAVIHLLFNLFGSMIFFFILYFVPTFNQNTFGKWFSNSPAEQIAMFHTFFNIACTLVFLPCIPLFVKLSNLIVPEKKVPQGEEANYSLMLDQRFLKNPGIALNQGCLYYHLAGKKALASFNLALDSFIAKDISTKQRIDSLNLEVMNMSKELTSFLVKVVNAGVNEQGNKRISNMQLDIADIVRLAEIADNISNYTKQKLAEDLHFSKIVYAQLGEFKTMINNQFERADKMVESPKEDLYKEVEKGEDAIDNMRTLMISQHMDRLHTGDCSPSSSGVFINLVGNLERAGDHLQFIAQRSLDKKVSQEPLKD